MSGVTFQVLCVIFFFIDKVVELVDGGSVINGPTLSSISNQEVYFSQYISHGVISLTVDETNEGILIKIILRDAILT